MKEFIRRTVTAFFLVIFAYGLIKFVPPAYFSLCLYLIISMAAYELVRLAGPQKHSLLLVFLSGLLIGLSFTFGKPGLLLSVFLVVLTTGLFFLFSIKGPKDLEGFVRDMGIHFLAVFYLYIPLYFLLELKKMGPNFLFFLVFVIAVGDSGAYFVGRSLGKRKIYPAASPNKTLEGLIAAIITASLTGWLSIVVFPVKTDVGVIAAVITGGVIGFLSQLSDPVESLFKRAAGEKDSGALLPGHGGILDRVDSYIFCAPALFYIIRYFWK